jgi:hypothetical protein
MAATICNATAKGSGKQCRQPVVEGSTKCRYHGGLTPRGIASPHFRHGRHSKYLPGDLRALYAAALNDADRVDMMDELALIDARAAQVLEQIRDGNTAASWARMRQEFAEFDGHLGRGNTQAAQAHLQAMRTLLAEGTDVHEQWQEVYDLIDRRRKVALAVMRRQKDEQQMVPVQEVMAMIAVLAERVHHVVSDPRERIQLATEIIDITTRERVTA